MRGRSLTTGRPGYSRFPKPVAGLFNKDGLKRFYDTLNVADLLANQSVTGCYFVGDGVPFGTGLSRRLDAFPYQTRRIMQALLLPDGVGGEGYISPGTDMTRFVAEGTEGSGWGRSNGPNGYGAAAHCRNNNDDTSRVRVTFTPTTDPKDRYGITSLELKYNRQSSAIANYDFDTGSGFVTIGAGDVYSGSYVLGGGAGADSDQFYSLGAFGVSGLNPAQQYTVQFSRLSGYCYLHGLYAYCNDEFTGYHSVNLALGTGSTTAFLAYTASDDIFKKCTSGAGLGSTLMRLGCFNYIIQEWIDGTTPATFKANIASIISSCLGAGLKPCLLWLIPFQPNPSWSTALSRYGTSAAALAAWEALRVAVKEAALAAPNDLAVLDMNDRFPGLGYSDFNSRGWMADNTTPSVTGHSVIAQAVAEAQLGGPIGWV